MSASDSSSKQTTFEQSVNQFVDGVSIVGARYIFLSSAWPPRRVFWLILVTFGAGFTAYQIRDKVLYLLSHPTSTNIRIVNNKTLRFPTLTICNENFLSRRLAEQEGVVDLITAMYPPIPIPGFKPNFDAHSDVFGPNSTVDWDGFWQEWSQKKEAAIDECTWKGKQCNASWFETVPTNMGYCFQFNPKNASFLATREGAAYGLEIFLFVDQDDYLAAHSISAGFRALLHHPDETPLMQEAGIKVTGGFHTLISAQLQTVTTLEPPWGKCSSAEGYTRSGCLARCTADHVITNCSCKEPYMPGTARTCNPQEVYECVMPSVDAFIANDLQAACDCPPQCESYIYRHSVSQAKASLYASYFIADILGYPREVGEYIMADFAVLTVFFSELSYEEIKSEKAYDTESLWCDIGGAFGILLGSTLLTLVEIGDFCVTQAWKRLFPGNQLKQQDKKLNAKL